MKQGDFQKGAPGVLYMGSQAPIEAMTVPEGSMAYATDLHTKGYYNGTVWVWGGYSHLMDLVHASLIPNTDPIDFVISSVTGWVALVYFGSHTGATWKSASSNYTVPTGKVLVPINVRVSGVVHVDHTSRRMLLYNTTDASEVVSSTITSYNGYLWQGDVATPSAFPSVAAGKTVEIRVWDADASKRAMGGYYICKLNSV